MVASAPPSDIPSALDSSFAPAEFSRHAATARDFDDEDPGQGAPLLEALLAETARPSRLGLPVGAGSVFKTAGLLTLLAIVLAIAGARLGLEGAWVRLFD